MGEQSFRLPDVGEGLTEAEVLRWLVQPGDHVEVNQMVVEIETAKAAVELPCPFAGTVAALLVEAGSIVPVGTPIITVLTADAAPAPERQSVLVGYGVREASEPARRRRRASTAGPEPIPSTEPVAEESAAPPTATERPRAKPPVRRLARELGVDLRTVPSTGAHGEVTRADVLATSGTESRPPHPRPTPAPPAAAGERIPVRGVHRAMAEAMVSSAFTAPHVTEWVEVDMTRALHVLGRLRDLPDAAEVRMTPMALVAVGLVRAAVRHPLANSTWVEQPDGPHVHLHADVNLGIAVDTPRGLVVPVVRSASGLGVLALAARIQALIEAARAGRATPADLTGGTISLTNIGVFGIDGGTPILSPGQTAILAMGRILDRPWVVDGSVVPRPVMQLSLSFDHRVIDGAVGSRVLRDVADFLDDPALALALDREIG